MRRVAFGAVVLLAFASGAAAARPVARPAMVTREEWGSKPQPIPESRRQTPAWVTIHHAGEVWRRGADPVAFLRRLQVWGQNRPTQEPPPRNTYWPDLPYHFMIAPDGRIFEARPVEYEPESNTSYPLSGNIGVELMGDFERQRPSLAQLRSCVALTAWLCATWRLDLAHVRTHRDAAPGQTDCPGKDFYRHFEDGSFKRWVREGLRGRTPRVRPGRPLAGGPTTSVED